MNRARRHATVAFAAIVGIALAATITWGTSQLVSQRIGLASQPLTAGRGLLPSSSRARPVARVARPPAAVRSAPSHTSPAAAPPSSPAVASPSTTAVAPVAPAQATPGSGAPAAPATPSGEASRSGGEGGDSSPRRDD
jgi:hypothetical protein